MAIKPCKCTHAVQDELHGKGMRVHNKAKHRIAGKTAWRCTACGTKKE